MTPGHPNPSVFLSPYTSALAAISVSSALSVPGVPALGVAFLLILLVPALMVSRLPQSRRVRGVWTGASVVFAAGAVVELLVSGRPSVQTLLVICSFALVQKMFTLGEARDHLQVWSLSAVFVAAACLTGSGLFLAAVPIIWGLASALFLYRLSQYRSVCLIGRPVRSTLPARPSAVSVLAPLALGAAVLFVVIPRFGDAPRTLLPPQSGGNLLATGASDVIDLGRLSRIRENDSVALRIRGDRSAGEEDLRLNELRVRLGALAYFTGSHWERWGRGSGESRLLHAQDSSAGVSVFDLAPPQYWEDQPRTIRYTVDLRETGGDVLPLPEGTVRVALEGANRGLLLDPDGRVRLPGGSPRVSRLIVETAAEPVSLPLLARQEPPRDIHTWLPSSVDQPEIRAMARETAGQAASPLGKARLIAAYLRREGSYTMDLPDWRGGDGSLAVTGFLTGDLRGHCELFASGMTVLARTLDVPSRIVIGYSGGDYDPEREELVVRQKDAHAWVEVYDAQEGWVAFDPTPSQPLVTAGDRLVFSQLRKRALGLLQGVSNSITGYDERTQREAVSSAFEWIGQTVGSYEDGLLMRTWARVRTNAAHPLFGVTVALLLMLNLLAYVGYRRLGRGTGSRRGAKSGWRERRRVPPLLQDVVSLLSKGPKAGREVRPGQTPSELLGALAAESGYPGETARELAGLYSAWRYGGDDAALGALRERIRSMRKGRTAFRRKRSSGFRKAQARH